MKREKGHGVKEKHSQLFLAMVCTLLFLAAAGLCSCGSGGGSDAPAGSHSSPATTPATTPETTTTTTTAATLVSITITPSNPLISVNIAQNEQKFTATGTYSDGTSQDLTSVVTWSSSDTSKATIDAAGKASAIAAGQTTITATSGSVSTTSIMTITLATLKSIAVTLVNTAGTTPQIVAIGTYSDNTAHDLTNQVTKSTYTGADGAVTITAAIGDIFGSVTYLGTSH